MPVVCCKSVGRVTSGEDGKCEEGAKSEARGTVAGERIRRYDKEGCGKA